MSCRVGITTDPERREREWRRIHSSLWDWQILGDYWTKSAAQAREDLQAARRGCVHGPGGAGDEYDHWFVYLFRYL